MFEVHLKLIRNTLIVGCILTPLAFPAWQWSKDYRAGKLMQEAENLFAQEKYYEAWQKASAANMFNSEDFYIREKTAAYSVKANIPNAIDYWRPLLTNPDRIPAKDLEDLLLFIQNSNSENELFLVLNSLFKVEPDNELSREVYLKTLQKRQLYPEILKLTSRWIDEGSVQEAVVFSYTTALFKTKDLRNEKIAKEFLNQLAQRNDLLGLKAIQELLKHAQDTEEISTLAALMRENPNASLEDKIFTIDWNAKVNDDDFATTHNVLLSLLSEEGEDYKSSIAYYKWLERHGKYQIIMNNMEFYSYENTPELFPLYLEALIETNQPQKVFDVTLIRDKKFPLSESQRLLFRYKALNAMGQIESSEEALNMAIKYVDIDDFNQLELELSKRRNWDSLFDLYFHLSQSKVTEGSTSIRLVFANYFLKDEPALLEALKKIDLNSLPDNVDIQAFVLYLKILYNTEDALKAKLMAEDLITRNPSIFQIRIVLAFAHLISGNADTAKSLIKYLPQTLEPNSQPFLRTALGFLATAFPESSLLIDTNKNSFLLPRETAFIRTL